jgi:hypothetical protein
MFERTRILGNVRVGKPDVEPSLPSHVAGVREGNEPGSIFQQPGFRQDPDDARFATATAERSTGINPRARDPIDPRMPHLPPP